MSADKEKIEALTKRVDELVLIMNGIMDDLRQVSASLKSLAVSQITQPIAAHPAPALSQPIAWSATASRKIKSDRGRKDDVSRRLGEPAELRGERRLHHDKTAAVSRFRQLFQNRFSRARCWRRLHKRWKSFTLQSAQEKNLSVATLARRDSPSIVFRSL